MSARRIDMHRLEELVRLHRRGRSARAIARRLKMGRDTARSYLKALEVASLLEGEADRLPSVKEMKAALRAQAPEKGRPRQEQSSVESWREEIERLRKMGAGPTAIYDWLRLHKSSFSGSLSAVKRSYAQMKKTDGPQAVDIVIPVDTVPGEIAQVDFVYAGKIYDPARGLMRKTWLFVLSLGFSRHMYVDLVFDQKIETWIRLHIDAFAFLGCVPRVLVPDNLKAAVIRAAFGLKDEPAINRSYAELARYYGFEIDPTPPRSPEKKGKVERSGRYVKYNFLATHESIDIDEDRKALTRWNLEIAARRRHGTTGKVPIELFEEVEKAASLALPARPFEPVIWKHATVHRDTHVQVDAAFYSVPWRFVGQKLWVQAAPRLISIEHEGEQIAMHPRVKRGQRSTIDAHLPEHRRDLRHRSRTYWVDRAMLLGEAPLELVEAIFDSDDVLHQLRKVQAVVKYLENFPRERACNAARRALHFGCLSYQGVKNILTKGLDLEPLEIEEEQRDWARESRFSHKPTEQVLAFMKRGDDDDSR